MRKEALVWGLIRILYSRIQEMQKFSRKLATESIEIKFAENYSGCSEKMYFGLQPKKKEFAGIINIIGSFRFCAFKQAWAPKGTFSYAKLYAQLAFFSTSLGFFCKQGSLRPLTLHMQNLKLPDKKLSLQVPTPH